MQKKLLKLPGESLFFIQINGANDDDQPLILDEYWIETRRKYLMELRELYWTLLSYTIDSDQIHLRRISFFFKKRSHYSNVQIAAISIGCKKKSSSSKLQNRKKLMKNTSFKQWLKIDLFPTHSKLHFRIVRFFVKENEWIFYWFTNK